MTSLGKHKQLKGVNEIKTALLRKFLGVEEDHMIFELSAYLLASSDVNA